MTPRPAAPSDPAVLLALLWRHTAPLGQTGQRRGPRPACTVDDVVEAAIALADRDGLEAVSMRAVAGTLGVATMSVYTYVPGKAELVDLMVDAVHAHMSRPPWGQRSWQERVRAVADSNYAVLCQHSWLAVVSSARPVLGPGGMAKYDHELSAFEGLGLDDVTVDDALGYLLTFVHGAAREATAARASELTTALSDQQWWERNAPLLAQVFDERTYPTAARIGSAAGAARGSAYDPDHAYAFGLARTLEGIHALVHPA